MFSTKKRREEYPMKQSWGLSGIWYGKIIRWRMVCKDNLIERDFIHHKNITCKKPLTKNVHSKKDLIVTYLWTFLQRGEEWKDLKCRNFGSILGLRDFKHQPLFGLGAEPRKGVFYKLFKTYRKRSKFVFKWAWRYLAQTLKARHCPVRCLRYLNKEHLKW